MTPSTRRLGQRGGKPVERLSRVAPAAISFAISGSYAVEIVSPSSTPASTRIDAGSRSRSIVPAWGRNVRGSSA